MATGRTRLLTALLAVALLAVAVPSFARTTGAHGRALLVLAAAVTPLVVPLAVVLLLLCAGLHRRVLTLLTAALLVLNGAWVVPELVGDAPGSGPAVTVMSANLRLGRADVGDVLQAVRQRHVDLLVLVELTPEERDRLRAAGLDQLLPQSDVDARPASLGSGIWSRWPLTPLPAWTGGQAEPGALVHSPHGDVVLRAVHTFPATVQDGAGPYVSGFADLQRQADALDPGVPAVVAGDFNATRDDVELRRLMGDRFRDAAEIAGGGLQWTFRPFTTGLPLLHLDHVLLSPQWGVRGVATVSVRQSDHLAVVARLVLHQRAGGMTAG